MRALFLALLLTMPAGLAVIAEMRQGFGEFYRSVKSLAQSDPEPKVQAAARKLLD